MDELVSIIMPSYNAAKYIQEAVNSIVNQTYKKWELIIIDDFSTDNTESIIKSIKDDRIRYYKNKKNIGAALSRNFAIKNARGRWIAFLDSDDIWLPEKLDKQIKFMTENNYGFTYSKYFLINEDSIEPKYKILGPKRISKLGMYSYCWIGALTAVYDAKLVGLVQIENLKKNNDYAMWLKIIKKTDCYLYDEFLAKYRKREGSISNQKKIKLIKWHYQLFRKSENFGRVKSVVYTLRNILFGIIKKALYVKKF
jgi:glycosyltransferase involved in cell wall biosynthesis